MMWGTRLLRATQALRSRLKRKKIQSKALLRAFTYALPKENVDITIEVDISPPNPLIYDEEGEPIKPSQRININSLWDTGSTHCAITKKKANELKLKPISKVNVYHAHGMKPEVNVYLMHLILPNGSILQDVKATEYIRSTGNYDFIVGLEVIKRGDFAITNCDGKMTVSFRIPSAERIDFLGSHYIPTKYFLRKERNSPCFCGSGKKLKHCHGNHLWRLLIT
jgi:predicted aspartyl protease